MAIAIMTLDALNFAQQLEAVGVAPKVAETQAKLQAEIVQKQTQEQQQVLDKFAEYQPFLKELQATKHELATKGDLKNEICWLRNELKAEINGLRGEVKSEINGLRGEVKSEINGLRSEVKSEINGLRNEFIAEMKGLENSLLVKLGAVIVASMTVFGVIMNILINHAH